MADWFLTGDDFGFLADIVSNWLAYGIGLGAVVWLLGLTITVVVRFVKY